MPTHDIHDLSIDLLNEYIARGHAFNKHVSGADPAQSMKNVNAFRSKKDNFGKKLGPDLGISSPDDYKDYLSKIIDDKNTIGFRNPDTGGITLYNKRDNVMALYNPFDRDKDFGTAYRYENSRNDYIKIKKEFDTEEGFRTFFKEFDNEKSPGSVRQGLNDFISDIKNNSSDFYKSARNADGVDFRDALAHPDRPGRGPNSPNNQIGLSKTYTHIVPEMNRARPALESGDGFAAALDEKGRPDKMFFLDKENARVVEIEGHRLTTHDFSNLPPGERLSFAETFFHNKYAGAAEAAGHAPEIFSGYNNLARDYNINTGKMPAAGTNLDVLAGNADKETLALASASLTPDDAARAVLGLEPDEYHVLKNLPEDLSSVTDQSVRAAGESLNDARRMMAAPEDAVIARDMYVAHIKQLDPSVREGLMAITAKAGSAEEAAKATRQMGEMIMALKEARIAAAAGKTGIVLTGAMVAASFALTRQANAALLEAAGDLKAQGRLPDDAHAAYREMMKEVGAVLEAQSLDPSPAALLTMAAAETIAYNRFQEFSNEYHLPQDIHHALAPGLIAGESVRGAIGKAAERYMPADLDAVPDILHPLAETKIKLNEAEENLTRVEAEHNELIMIRGGPIPASFDVAPEVLAARESMKAAGAQYQYVFDRTLENPQASRIMLGYLPEKELLAIVKDTVPYADRDSLSPPLRAYRDAAQDYEQASYIKEPIRALELRGKRNAAAEALTANPDLMRDHITSTFASPEPPMAAAERHPAYINVAIAAERVKSGEPLDPVEKRDMQIILKDPFNRAVANLLEERYGGILGTLDEEKNAPVAPILPLHVAIGQPDQAVHSAPRQ
jgi:hypothetical protein